MSIYFHNSETSLPILTDINLQRDIYFIRIKTQVNVSPDPSCFPSVCPSPDGSRRFKLSKDVLTGYLYSVICHSRI